MTEEQEQSVREWIRLENYLKDKYPRMPIKERSKQIGIILDYLKFQPYLKNVFGKEG